MSLSTDQILGSVKRFLPFFKATQDEIRQYVISIQEALGWMQPIHFEEVCMFMLKRVSSGRKPTPKEFMMVYREIGEPRGWLNKPPRVPCSTCIGHMVIPKTFLVEHTSETVRAFVPCPTCGPKNWSLLPGLIERDDISPKDLEDLHTISKIRPSHARELLDRIEKTKECSLSQRALTRLIERSGEKEPESSVDQTKSAIRALDWFRLVKDVEPNKR